MWAGDSLASCYWSVLHIFCFLFVKTMHVLASRSPLRSEHDRHLYRAVAIYRRLPAMHWRCTGDDYACCSQYQPFDAQFCLWSTHCNAHQFSCQPLDEVRVLCRWFCMTGTLVPVVSCLLSGVETKAFVPITKIAR